MSPKRVTPEQKTEVDGVIAPCSSAASATTGLNVDPGAYTPAIALLVSGDFASDVSAFHSSVVRPRLKAPGSNAGVDTIARISPESTSSTTAAPLSDPRRC